MSVIWVYTGTDLTKKHVYAHPSEYNDIEISINTITFIQKSYSEIMTRFILKHAERIISSDNKFTIFDVMIAFNENEEIFMLKHLPDLMMNECKTLQIFFSQLFEEDIRHTASDFETLCAFKKKAEIKLSELCLQLDLHTFQYTDSSPETINNTIISECISSEGIYQLYDAFSNLIRIYCQSMFSLRSEVVYFKIKVQ